MNAQQRFKCPVCWKAFSFESDAYKCCARLKVKEVFICQKCQKIYEGYNAIPEADKCCATGMSYKYD